MFAEKSKMKQYIMSMYRGRLFQENGPAQKQVWWTQLDVCLYCTCIMVNAWRYLLKFLYLELENVSLDYVIKFLTSVGVERLSSRVEILSQTEMYHPCPPLQMYVHDVIPFIQRMLYCYPTIYDYLVKEKAIKSKLATMQFAQVRSIEHTVYDFVDWVAQLYHEGCLC